MVTRKSIKKEIAASRAKHTREWKRKMRDDVCGKDRVETVGDVLGVFYGLSRNAVVNAALYRIQGLAAMGLTPVEIIGRMEPKKQKRPVNRTGCSADNKA
jgi:hypothetical protein